MNITITNSLRSLYIGILLLVLPLSIVAVLGHVIVSTIAGMSILPGMAGASGFLSSLKGALVAFDAIIVLLLSVIVGGIALRSFRLNMHPIFGVVGLLFLPVAVYAATFGSNFFGMFTGISVVGASINSFPFMYHIFNNMAVIVTGLGVLILIVMAAGSVIRR